MAIISDTLCGELADILKSYCNYSLGEAWKSVSNDDGYVIKNTICYPWENAQDMIRPQFPILSVYRSETKRLPFTYFKDYLNSVVNIDFIIEITDATQTNKWGMLQYVFTVIESLVQRDFPIDGYSLVEYLNVENIKVDKHEAKMFRTKGMREGVAGGFYIGSTKLKVLEIVNVYDECAEALEYVSAGIFVKEEDTEPLKIMDIEVEYDEE